MKRQELIKRKISLHFMKSAKNCQSSSFEHEVLMEYISLSQIFSYPRTILVLYMSHHMVC